MIPGRICVCVFAKPPHAGEVKTRLAASIGEHAAAQFAHTFLLDTLHVVTSLPWALPVLSSTASFQPADGIECWLQGDGSLDQRIERTLERALAITEAAIALGADSPGLP